MRSKKSLLEKMLTALKLEISAVYSEIYWDRHLEIVDKVLDLTSKIDQKNK